nr:MAG TPA: hypothetical protein [Caudoviricetes sp.]
MELNKKNREDRNIFSINFLKINLYIMIKNIATNIVLKIIKCEVCIWI